MFPYRPFAMLACQAGIVLMNANARLSSNCAILGPHPGKRGRIDD